MNGHFLLQAFVYLAAAVLGVPIAKRLGLGSVLGYLAAGVVIGPHVLGLVGQGGENVMHFAEFGVVMMLFLVGLELKPSVLWQLRRPILGLGGLQVAVTATVLAGGGLALGLPWQAALAIGLVLPASSTAIVLQSLNEKRLLQSSGGQAAFSVLLFQDIAVIPILAVFPILGARGADHGEASRPGWLQALLVLGAVSGIVLAGRFIVRPGFRLLAETRLREAFTAAALLLVVGIALLMELVGLSAALGTFLAGVVLAESEYRHELEGDIEPFKGLLLGLFFISVGAQIDFAYIGSHAPLVGALVAGIMLVKFGVLYVLARAFGLDRSARWLFAFSLAQVGEFAFVLLSYGVQSGIYGDELATPLVAVVALSMGVTPLFFIALERFVLPRVAERGAVRAHDTIEHGDKPVVIAGFGRVGQVVGRILRASGIGTTVLDLDPAMVDILRRLNLEVHYGDASRLDLLTAAGCAKAKLFILAIDDPEASVAVAELVRRNFPQLRIIARARNREHYYKLKRLGIDDLHRETLASAMEMSVATLRALGFRAHTAERLARLWRGKDEQALAALAKVQGEGQDAYFAAARLALADAERAMRDETDQLRGGVDDAWDNDSLREELLARQAAERKNPG